MHESYQALSAPAQQQPTNPGALTPTNEPVQQPATKPQVSEAGPAAHSHSQSSTELRKEEAWQILNTACTGDKTSGRATAIRVLGLMPKTPNPKLAEKVLDDDKPEVRSMAAAVLGEMKSRTSVPKLRAALDDNDPWQPPTPYVLMHDDSAYKVYYEVLTSQRKAGRGLIASETFALKDPKKMAQLGIEEGIGFIPFAGVGGGTIKAITKDDSSPVRAAAATVLAKDPDPATTKSAGRWGRATRAGWYLLIGETPSVPDTVRLYMSDEKDAVRYTAAAAVLRLTVIEESGSAVVEQKKKEGKEEKKAAAVKIAGDVREISYASLKQGLLLQYNCCVGEGVS